MFITHLYQPKITIHICLLGSSNIKNSHLINIIVWELKIIFLQLTISQRRIKRKFLYLKEPIGSNILLELKISIRRISKIFGMKIQFINTSQSTMKKAQVNSTVF